MIKHALTAKKSYYVDNEFSVSPIIIQCITRNMTRVYNFDKKISHPVN